MFAQRRQHRVPLDPQRLVFIVNMLVHIVAKVFLNGQGGELVDAPGLETQRPLAHRLRRRQIAHADARRDNLGHRADIQYLPAVVHAADGSHIRPLKAQVNIAVILQHRHAVVAANLQRAPPAFQRHRPAQRVLKSRDGVEKLDPLARRRLRPYGFVQRLRDDAVAVALDAHHFGPPQPHLPHRPQIDILLSEQHIAGVGQGLDQHIDRLPGAGSQHNVIGGHCHLPVAAQLVGHQFPQRQVAGRRRIVGQIAPFPFQCHPQSVHQPIQRQRVRVGVGHRKVILGIAVGRAGSDRGAGGKQPIIVELRHNDFSSGRSAKAGPTD